LISKPGHAMPLHLIQKTLLHDRLKFLNLRTSEKHLTSFERVKVRIEKAKCEGLHLCSCQ